MVKIPYVSYIHLIKWSFLFRNENDVNGDWFYVSLYIKPDAYAEKRDTTIIRGLFELCKVPKTNSCQEFSSQNDNYASKIKFFKDKTKENPIIVLVELKPKTYSYTTWAIAISWRSCTPWNQRKKIC